MHVDESALETFTGRLATEMAGAWGMASVHLGVRLGLYAGLVEGPATSHELARRTGTNERLVREWLVGQAVAGYVTVRASDRYALSEEQAMTLAHEDSPVYLGGLTEVLTAAIRGQEQIDAAFRGDGVLSWGDQHPALFAGFDHSFSPVYRAALVDHWIPAIEGLPATMSAGARVADVGAGRGTAVLLMAEAFPASTFTVIDLHRASLDAAAAKATDAGIRERITVQQASATDYGGGGYDLITFFDSLHDMGDPERVIGHARRQLAPDGVVMVVEPMIADDTRDEAGTLAARLFYPSSAMMCTPSGLASGRTALGNQVPDETWQELFQDNGFRVFRRAGQTPFNRVFEARP